MEHCGKTPEPAVIQFMAVHDEYVFGGKPPSSLMKKTDEDDDFDNIASRGRGVRVIIMIEL